MTVQLIVLDELFSARASGHRAIRLTLRAAEGEELIMSHSSLPTRTLPERPDIDQLKRQAKELLDAFVAGRPVAVAEVEAHYRGADRTTFALHDAQLALARAYGFESWLTLKAFVVGATVRRLRDAIIADNLVQVGAILKIRPELARASLEVQMLHHAVFNRSPEMVRLLMRHGAPARQGVYPHREATTPTADRPGAPWSAGSGFRSNSTPRTAGELGLLPAPFRNLEAAANGGSSAATPVATLRIQRSASSIYRHIVHDNRRIAV
jgi:hypothetical protein